MQVIVRRKVSDYEGWKKLVSQTDGMRRENGSLGATVYRSASDPNEVFMVFDWDERRPYRKYFERPDVQAALRDSGTTEFTEVSESFRLTE